MLTPLSAYYLQTMGIQTWQCKEVLSDISSLLDFQTYQLCSVSGEVKGELWLESLQIEPMEEAPMYRLLEAMLAAVHLKHLPIPGTNPQNPPVLSIIMGAGLAQQVLGIQDSLDTLRAANIRVQGDDRQILVTYHPLDLLRNPAYKARAWQDLKKLL